MNLDLTQIPFSRFGSYIAFSQLPAEGSRTAGLYLRSIHGPATGGRPMQELLRLELLQNHQPVAFETKGTFTSLELSSPSGSSKICLPDPSTVRIHLENASLRLEGAAGAYDYVIPGTAGNWRLTFSSTVETKFQFIPFKGHIEVDAPWQAEHCEHIAITLCPAPDGIGEFAIQESTVNWPDPPPHLPFPECQHQIASELANFTAKLPAVPAEYETSFQLAGYVLWSCVVEPQGNLTRPAILASKNGMIGAWSWDHAFHTLALAKGHPDLAWSQFMLLFDHQDQSGVLPDLINDRLISWSFCKPPIHGWILTRLFEKSDLLTSERLKEVYPRLVRWTNWWFEHRDDDHNGIPQYFHGNDSGWDNSSVFCSRPPIESPDLSALLICQMEFLATAAAQLGKSDEAQIWSTRASQLVGQLLSHFWRGDRFVAVEVNSHKEVASQSLLLSMPLVLGPRLPLPVRNKLISRLKTPGDFLSPFGLATESLQSPLYVPRGYWRGPIWPAPTLLLVESLSRCGEEAFAQNLRQRFCNLVYQSGMAENFDAQTGEGYHDFHFSWTASIFLTLANELWSEPRNIDHTR